MQVGTIVKLKRECLGNPAGTIGVVFYNYGDGSQVIFKNGEHDGFNEVELIGAFAHKTEKDFILEEVGFEPRLAEYQFKNVIQVSIDYSKGIFDCVLSRLSLRDEIN